MVFNRPFRFLQHSTILILIFSTSLGCVNDRKCHREFIRKHHIFAFVGSHVDPAKSFLEFKGDSLYEHADGNLKYVDQVVWTSCSRYLIISKATSADGFWKAGDTLQVDILDRIRDTLHVITTAKAASITMKLYKR